MGDDLENRRGDAGRGAEAQPQENVAHLCDRGIGNHPFGVRFPYSPDRTVNHGAGAEDQQYRANAELSDLLRVKYAAHDFDQQDYIALDDHTGQDRR